MVSEVYDQTWLCICGRIDVHARLDGVRGTIFHGHCYVASEFTRGAESLATMARQSSKPTSTLAMSYTSGLVGFPKYDRIFNYF